MTLGLTAFLITNLVSVPHFGKAARILRESQGAEDQTPSADFKRALRLDGASAGVSGVLLLVVLVFMVGAAFY